MQLEYSVAFPTDLDTPVNTGVEVRHTANGVYENMALR